jgi:hypothetical protein
MIGRPSEYKQEFNQIALDLMKEGASVIEVIAELNICKATFYDWTNEDSPRFNQEFSDTIKTGRLKSQAWWEKTGRKLLVEESEMNVKTGTSKSKRLNTAAWIFNMKNRFSDDWSDTHKQEVEVKNMPDWMQDDTK